ncbi:fe-containing alcohol protein [Diplodia corticola]|uniref:Fe-containing alcohol protein n=1 Tax=Diplodia corticola TaxID=236234 RepID=A0A1J9QRJ3_9PEZI|nr:fe-containing alcohol protein [Diplodia corticola]OJD31072.1 fe-containing alcohol protein [Diplodia corticola]
MSDSSQPVSSPPLTPPKQRKRKPDPFRELASTPLPSPLGSPGSPGSFASQDDGDEPALKKLVLTPLLFASFIISLFLVDRRNRAYRLAEHPPSRSPPWWSYFSPWQWLDPEPYRHMPNSTWQDASASGASGADGGVPGIDGRAELDGGRQADRPWFVSKMHRKVVRLEFREAFEMRRRVLVALGVVWTLGVLALVGRWVVATRGFVPVPWSSA